MPVVRTDGLPGGVRSRDYQIFLDGYFTTFSYLWCSAARFVSESSAMNEAAWLVNQFSQEHEMKSMILVNMITEKFFLLISIAVAICPAAGKGLKKPKCPAVRIFLEFSSKSLFLIV